MADRYAELRANLQKAMAWRTIQNPAPSSQDRRDHQGTGIIAHTCQGTAIARAVASTEIRPQQQRFEELLAKLSVSGSGAFSGNRSD